MYSTKIGYKFLDSIIKTQHPQAISLSAVEKQLWQNIWKVKAPPKIKHFLWRALSGALAVKERLQTRGFQLDTNCQQCGRGVESILSCSLHLRKSTRGLEDHEPPATYRRLFQLIDLLHLVSVFRNSAVEESSRMVFPWVLWHLWKARNGLAFENRVEDPLSIARRAFEEASSWIDAHKLRQEVEVTTTKGDQEVGWKKPPVGCLKFNIRLLLDLTQHAQ